MFGSVDGGSMLMWDLGGSPLPFNPLDRKFALCRGIWLVSLVGGSRKHLALWGRAERNSGDLAG